VILMADARIGELTREMQKTAPEEKGRRAHAVGSRPEPTPTKRDALAAEGISRKQAAQCEKIAAVQRAMVGGRLMPIYAEAAKKRQRAGGSLGGSGGAKVVADLPEALGRGQARDQAAAAVNVSPRSVQYAVAVLTKGTQGRRSRYPLRASRAAATASRRTDTIILPLAQGPRSSWALPGERSGGRA
jgi:hypothetical protein